MTIGGELAPHGYPDWQPVRAIADTHLFGASNQGVPGAGPFGPFFVGNFPSIGFICSVDFGQVACTFSFYLQQTLITNIGTHSIRCALNSFFNGSIAVLGPYVRLAVTDETGGGSQVDISLDLHQWRGNKQQSSDGNVLATKGPVTVANGATNTVQAPQLWPGWATMAWHTASAGPWTIFIEYMINSGLWVPLTVITAAWAEAPFTLCLPATPIRVRVVNNSGAAADFYYALVGEPHFNRW